MTMKAHDGRARYGRASAVITLLLFIDGFDLFLLGKIAPAVADSFGRPAADMRVVFTWHQVGLTAGAFLLPALADRLGLRLVLGIMTLLIGVGTFASSLASSLESFAVLRGFTGLFLAGVLPVSLSLLSDIVPASRRGAILAIAMVGMSAGAAANSIAAAWLLDRFGWASGLWLGALIPFLALPLIPLLLPEGKPFSAGELGEISPRPSWWTHLCRIFTGRRAPMTLVFWLVCFLTMGHTALAAAWLPTFFQELGGIEIQRFALVSMLTVIGGTLGTLSIGWLQDRSSPVLLTALAQLGNGLGIALLGQIRFDSAAFAVTFTAWSFLQSASITGLNLLLVRAYPIDIRATGSGWAAGLGRIGGLGAPISGAMILGAGLTLADCMLLVSLPMLLTFAAVMPLLALTMRRAAVGLARDDGAGT
jgi:AAHS family 4-hydroxybenzoate transporter-like MFS transporter